MEAGRISLGPSCSLMEVGLLVVMALGGPGVGLERAVLFSNYNYCLHSIKSL